jgi:16S rRNA C1402 N4-methylase RsmH
MTFLCRLSRRHYWCTPHRSTDRRLIQVCYECGAERPASELANEIAAERASQSLAAAKRELSRLPAQTLEAETETVSHQAAAISQISARKFSLIK